MNPKQKANRPAKKKPVGLCLMLPSRELREQFHKAAWSQGKTMTEAMLEMVREYIARGPNRSICNTCGRRGLDHSICKICGR